MLCIGRDFGQLWFPDLYSSISESKIYSWTGSSPWSSFEVILAFYKYSITQPVHFLVHVEIWMQIMFVKSELNENQYKCVHFLLKSSPPGSRIKKMIFVPAVTVMRKINKICTAQKFKAAARYYLF